MATQLERMTNEVVKWIRPMLPDDLRDPVNTSIKLSEEASELTHSIYTGDGSVGEELADILILLVDIAFLHDVDLQKEFDQKMAINKVRRWGIQKGAMKHED